MKWVDGKIDRKGKSEKRFKFSMIISVFYVISSVMLRWTVRDYSGIVFFSEEK